MSRVVDGVDALRRAVREELQMGADQIKIMASGGVALPTDPIGALGYRRTRFARSSPKPARRRAEGRANARTSRSQFWRSAAAWPAIQSNPQPAREES
ncbi:hypothetical protein OKW38_000947 [Paraburkholderia sp. MM5496-R1]